MPRRSATAADYITAAQRRERALELRKAGKSYSEIAADLGVTKQGVGKMLKRELTLLAESTQGMAAQYRQLELVRLDKLLAGIWDKAAGGDESAIDRALRIIAQRSKLLGLDMPIKVAPTDPTGENEWSGKSDTELVSEFNQILEAARARTADGAGDGA